MDQEVVVRPGRVGLTVDFAKRGTMAKATVGSGTDELDRRLACRMRDAQAGDKQAYASLLKECEPVIRRAARRVGLADNRVEDAVQETLLTLHHARQTYDPSRSFVAWLTAIAKRRAIDILRRTGRSERREIHAPLAYEQHVDAGADPSRGWEASKRGEALKAAIATLSASQREAVEHLALREQSLAEAAAETGRTTGALKVNLHRALKALRAAMVGQREADDG